MAEKDAKTVQVHNLRDDDAAEKTGPATGGSKLPWLVLVIGFLVMLLTPTASYFVVKLSLQTRAPEADAKKEKEKPKSEKGEKAEKAEPTLYNLNSMLVNILDTKGTRILKITPHLVLSEPEMAEKMKNLKPLLVDLITSVASAKTLDELDGPAGRENLKKDILLRVNKSLEARMTGSVADVYFDEFLIQ